MLDVVDYLNLSPIARARCAWLVVASCQFWRRRPRPVLR